MGRYYLLSSFLATSVDAWIWFSHLHLVYYRCVRAVQSNILLLSSFNLQKIVSDQQMSQLAVEIEQGHCTNTVESNEGAKELETTHSSSMLGGKLPIILPRYSALTNDYRQANDPRCTQYDGPIGNEVY